MIYVPLPISRMGSYKKWNTTWRANWHGTNTPRMFYSYIIRHKRNGDQQEKKKTLCKFLYNSIQLETRFYCYIYAIDTQRMNVLRYNNQFDNWSLDKMS